MASPSVFVSSTFYDLRYIREGLKLFVTSLGYSPILSEEGTVFYDPKTTAAEACLAEVPNSQIFILVIGGRYGHVLQDSGKSITNAEYQQAVASRIPVFALVEQGVYNDYTFYKANQSHPEKMEQLVFPHADSVKIFEFIDQVQRQAINNALVPFNSFADIETYLKNQWAGMMYSFLTREAAEAQVVDALALMAQVNQRIELIAEQILKNVGSVTDRIAVICLQRMIESQAVSDLRYVNISPTPADIIAYPDFLACAQALGTDFTVLEPGSSILISAAGEIGAERLEATNQDYTQLRNGFLELLKENDVSQDEFAQYEFRPLGRESTPDTVNKAPHPRTPRRPTRSQGKKAKSSNS
jgi:hypothetical protein